MQPARTAAILAEQGWAVTAAGSDSWQGTVRGDGASFPVRVRLGATDLEVVVGPIVLRPRDEGAAAALHTRTLAANAQIRMARFALDDDGNVVLCVDYPRAHLDDSEVRDALDAASYYASRWFADLSGTA